MTDTELVSDVLKGSVAINLNTKVSLILFALMSPNEIIESGVKTVSKVFIESNLSILSELHRNGELFS